MGAYDGTDIRDFRLISIVIVASNKHTYEQNVLYPYTGGYIDLGMTTRRYNWTFESR